LVLIYDWQGGEFAKRLRVRGCESRESVGDAISRGDRIVCYDAERGESKEDLKSAGFDWWCEMCFEVSGKTPGRKLIVADELQDLVDPYNIPDPLSDILCRGGRREADTCLMGTSANVLHGTGRNQVTELYCFRCVDENALKYPKALGLDPETIKGLPDCRFLFWDARTGEKKELELWGGKRNPSS
jgi:hypothetical protein